MAGRRERLAGEVIAVGQSEPDLCIMAERLKDGQGADMGREREASTVWKLEASRVVIDTPWVTIRDCDYRLPGERLLTGFVSLSERPGVNVLALDQSGDVLLVRQYRPAVAKVVYDFPGGYLEATDDSPAERARAELGEETGYACTELLSSGQIHVAPHRSDKTDYTFLALGCEKAGAARLDETEDITFSIVPMPALGGLINTGEFGCCICLASLSLARIARPGLFRAL